VQDQSREKKKSIDTERVAESWECRHHVGWYGRTTHLWGGALNRRRESQKKGKDLSGLKGSSETEKKKIPQQLHWLEGDKLRKGGIAFSHREAIGNDREGEARPSDMAWVASCRLGGEGIDLLRKGKK